MNLKRITVTGLTLALGLTGLMGTANAATNTTTTSHYQLVTKTTTVGRVTIPANTRVYVIYFSKKNGQKYATVELSTLRYQIRHATTAKYLKVRVNHNLKAVKSVAMDQLPVMRQPKTNVTDQGRQDQNTTIRFTSDGYVEYFKNDQATTKPTSSTKVTKSAAKGQTTYIYAKHNMLKLPDKKISNKGNYRYRLMVHFNGAQAAATNAALSYSVGSKQKLFYTPAGNA
ncbi:hypothetical protein [Secundilactobacillus muriivasis]